MIMATDNKDKVLNVPTLRFPEFTDEWSPCSIKDFGTIVTGNTPPTKDTGNYIDGTLLWASPTDLGKGKYVYDTITKLTRKGFDKTRKLPKGSILVICIGSTIGKMGMSSVEMSTNQQINSIIVNSNMDNDFVYHAIERAFPRYLTEVGTQAVPILSKSSFENLPNHFTSKDEQNKIGKLFNLLEERIATQTKVIEDLKKLRVAICDELLGTTGNNIPICEILIERKERTTQNNQYEVLSSTVNGIYSQRDYFSKDIASADNVGYKIIRKGDIVLSPQNLWMGNINYNDNFNVGIVSPSYKVYSIRDNFDCNYVAAMLKTHRALYNYMLVSEQGASIVRRNLNVEMFEQLTFVVPSIEEQCKIGSTLKAIQIRIDNALSLLNGYNKQKRYLLQQMFI